jgi:aryl-alcohol dehydrogenase-like predicted oxidoreductase
MAPAPPAAARPLSVLTLGTAQLGAAYGVANRVGMPSAAEAASILDAAAAAGIAAFDTARAYGEAEARIGAWLATRPGAARPVLISKFPRLPAGASAVRRAALEAAWRATTRALGIGRLDHYLAHAAADAADPEVVAWLTDKVAAGEIGAWGASVYEPDEARRALAAGAQALQAPLNVFDRRFFAAGVLAEARAAGATLFARSLFLQGALLVAPAALPAHLAALAPALSGLGALAAESGRSVAALALAAVRDLPGVSSLVVGVDRAAQVPALAAAAAAPALDDRQRRRLAVLAAAVPAAVLDPRRWPKT